MGSNVKAEMASMGEECYCEAGNQTLKDKRVKDQINKLDKSACKSLNDDLVPEGIIEDIFNPTTSRLTAMHHLEMALKHCSLPKKMTVFLDKLKDTHPQHYKIMNKVYQEKINDHKECQQGSPCKVKSEDSASA